MPQITLDLGCGSHKIDGSIGIDIVAARDVDILGELGSLPVMDDAADAIYASHVLEHTKNLVETLEEIWRVSKKGARIYIWSPHYSCGLYAWGDPTHIRPMSSTTFDFFESNSIFHGSSAATFKILRRELHFRFRPPYTAAPKKTIIMRLMTVSAEIIDPIVNFNRTTQLFCERFLANQIGFEEIYFELETIK